MELNEKKIWFPAKRYGWGWGLPVCWQGWVVLVLFVVSLSAGAIVLLPNRHPVWFGAYVIALASVLFLVCHLKGEKPGWRWGGRR